MPSFARQLSTSNEEVANLMVFKHSVDSDPNGFLGNWTANSASPCSWKGVICSADGHVTTLNLNNFGLIGGLNLPTLTALPYLIHLFLRGNSFSAGDLSTSSSCNLETIDLSLNNLSGPLPPRSFFLSCDHLSYVNLSHNSISGGTLHFGPSLLQLDLSRNKISESTFLSYSLSSCQNLNLLNFSDNKLAGKLSVTPLSCKNLSTLDLSYNLLSGEIQPRFVAEAPGSLKYLDLSHNNFSGKLSNLDFGQCSNLTVVNLSQNIFSGSEFPTSLKNCQLLETLNLSHNALQDKIPGLLVGNLKKLKHLSLAHNKFTGEIPPELGQVCGTLEELDLSFNKLTGELPSTFVSCSSLHSLNLGNNLLSGDFLSTVVSKLSSLINLYVPFNNISGPVPLSLTHCTQLRVLDLSSNALTGTIPSGFCSSPNLSALERIVLPNNYLSGTVPLELENCKNLKTIDLSFNSLRGAIPLAIWTLPNLSDLVMWANNLTGEIPEEICANGGNLETLILNNNLLRGKIPQSISRCTNMIWVSLSSNLLSGEIPAGIGDLPKLAVLQLGNNSLSGQIPSELGKCRSLIWLDLNSNDLSGALPPALADQAGLVMPGIVSGKQFAFVRNEGGTSCRGAGGLVEFEGIRPERLEGFPMVHSCQLTTFPASRYENNSGLCGLPLSLCGSGSHTAPFRSGGNKQTLEAGVIIGITFFVLCILGLTLALYRVQKYQQKEEQREKYIESLPTSGSSSWKLSSVPEPLSINVATFEKPLRKLTFAHLMEATNGFSADSLIGTGGFGEVYKAQLRNGCVVAIKKLIRVKGQGDREFMAEMETIGKIKHRNLVPLLGYCKIGEERLLVYEYMKWGSLESVLHDRAREGSTRLDWAARKKIAIGSARGLAFLHHSCLPHIIHRDMKSSNVLLDENFEARVSDFGMARLVNALDTHLSVSTLTGTPGYVPPEYYQSFRCTTKGDVYSYGVILLELLSGKRPTDPSQFGDDNNLVGWAKQLHREKRSNEILDPELMTQKPGEAELFQCLRIAFECLDDRPHRRPTMIQVMAMFKELQVDTESDSLDGFSLKDTVIEELREKEP
ncbi:hypothetical protein Patl1_03666 [Pistacia atlantica]|uniref:Uncharacterized protein n=1 Tax=Pistacia atlantica TaxID=434234 RepID=A0ACC1BX48_9ROSI|nr:hypothetical protein Patl1_03666 [Pistacia atlantica]